MTSYNTETAFGQSVGPSCQITIPSGINDTDLMLLYVNAVTNNDPSTLDLSIASTGTSWTKPSGSTFISSAADSGAGYWEVAALFECDSASASDAGKIVTVSSTVDIYWDLTLIVYSDAEVEAFEGTAIVDAVTVICPSLTTANDDDWVLYFGGLTDTTGSITEPAGTERISGVTPQGVRGVAVDSNGSVGASGTSVGGGSFTDTGGGSVWNSAITVILKTPSSGTPVTVTGVAAEIVMAGGTGSVTADITETIWSQADPTGVSGYATTTEDGSYGLLFTVDADCTLSAIWFYSPSGATSLPSETALYSTPSDGSSSTLIAQNNSPSWSGAAGSGWVRDDSFPATSISTGVYYVAQYYGSGFKQGYLYTGALGVWFPSSSSSGLITAPAGLPASAGNNAPYVNSTDGFPSTWWTPGANVNWLADVEVTTSSGASVSITGVSAEIVIAGGIGSVQTSASVHISGVSAEIVMTGQPGLEFVLVSSPSTSGGVTTYSTFSEINNTGSSGAQDMRVLPPDSPSSDYVHAFLWLLPVEPGQGTTYGDSIATVKDLNAHNNFNLTCIQPGYPTNPWYGNSVDDPQTQQVTFLLQLVRWAKDHLAVTGTEKHYLIGFSKSGFGSQTVFLQHQDIFSGVISWDTACDLQNLAGDYGGDATTSFGEQSQLDGSKLYDPNLVNWKALGDTGTINRIQLAAGIDLVTPTSDYAGRLTADGILNTYTYVAADSHQWAPTPGWVEPGLERLLGVPVHISGTAAEIVIAGGAGSVTANSPVHISGTAAEIVVSGTPGSVRTSAKIPGAAAGIVIAGGTGAPKNSVHIPGASAEIVVTGTPGSVTALIAARIPGIAASVIIAGSPGSVKVGVPAHVAGIAAVIAVSGGTGRIRTAARETSSLFVFSQI